MWHVTGERWQVTGDTMWQYKGLMNIISKFRVPCSYRLGETYFKASALWADAFYKSQCPSVCPSVRLSVCLFTFEVPFNRLLAPTSQSWMSNIFRDSESLGKSNGMKWSNIWTFWFENGLISPHKKKFFFADFAGYNRLIPLICGL